MKFKYDTRMKIALNFNDYNTHYITYKLQIHLFDVQGHFNLCIMRRQNKHHES